MGVDRPGGWLPVDYDHNIIRRVMEHDQLQEYPEHTGVPIVPYEKVDVVEPYNHLLFTCIHIHIHVHKHDSVCSYHEKEADFFERADVRRTAMRIQQAQLLPSSLSMIGTVS